jgi:methionyl-tRNA synthetase
MARRYLTVSIPYVNAAPHLGYALELVQADALARLYRATGDEVRLLGGTDDHALKNALAAEAAGVDTQSFVDGNAARFQQLQEPLGVEFDDFIRTSVDPRHRPTVEALWELTASNGDFYRRKYEGQYCVGCEQFYTEDELVEGSCPEHETPTELVAEDNWFFRLSRYQEHLEELIVSGRLRIEPRVYANEVLSFVRGGLSDISVSRSQERAHGWGLPVPGDPSQVVYVWWDALANYISALDFAGNRQPYKQWWLDSDDRIHLIGKGILRFHAVYWPALLLSAGQPLPSRIFVHPYLTANGRKLSKSTGNVVDPVDVAARFGSDALRWWLLSDVPRAADADYTDQRLVERHDADLANGVGNLATRVVTMIHRFRDGRPPAIGAERPPSELASYCEHFDLRAMVTSVNSTVAEANRRLEESAPWLLAKAERAGDAGAADQLDESLAAALGALRRIVHLLGPLTLALATRLEGALSPLADGRLPSAEPLIPRLGE